MRYLVTMESVDSGDAAPPQETAAMLENVVLPSLKQLAEWEKAGTIRGGLMAGRRGVAFILDADSNEAVSDMLGMLPVWGTAEVDVLPLESVEYRMKAMTQTIQAMKNM